MSLQRMKSVKSWDFYKKLPRCVTLCWLLCQSLLTLAPRRDVLTSARSDLTEATMAGAWISISASILMLFLFSMVMRHLQGSLNLGSFLLLPNVAWHRSFLP
jgi:hypothetical protein